MCAEGIHRALLTMLNFRLNPLESILQSPATSVLEVERRNHYSISKNLRAKIIREIIDFYREKGRDFPWRKESDPFIILVTEVMLRKTTAKKLTHCWTIFFNKYPNIITLANADPEDIESIIFPLGLQRQRSRDLKKMATQISERHNQKIPINHSSLIKIHGVGTYSANATLCFAFHKIVPIIDVNVSRLYTRLFGIEFKKDIYNDKDLLDLATYLIPKRKSKIKVFNYGLLDFGANVCRAISPRCGDCPFERQCKFRGAKNVKK